MGMVIHDLIYRIIKAMVKKYPDCLQYRDEYDGTAFLTACGYGHVQLAEQLRYIKDWVTRVHAMIDGRGQIDYSIVPNSRLRLIFKYKT